MRLKHLLLDLKLLHLSHQDLIDLGEGLVFLSKRAHLSGKIIMVWRGVWWWLCRWIGEVGVGSWYLEVWPLPIRPRKTPTDLVSIRHMVVGVVTLVEASLARIEIEARSSGLVVL